MTEIIEIVRTTVCPLETSDRKNGKLFRGVEDFRRVVKRTAELLPSFPESQWKRNNTQIYRTVKAELDEYQIKDKVVQNAVHRVIENFKSTKALGNKPPKNGIRGCDFLILTTQGYEIAPNDRGYGLKAKFIPYKPEWWHLDIGSHQEEYLNRVFGNEASFGQVELSYNDSDPVARIAVSWEQEVTAENEAEYVVGVDVGYRSLYAAAVRDCESGEIVAVDIQTGDEFHHKRNTIQRRLTRFKQHGKLDQAQTLRQKERRYTNQTMHKYARRLVEFASDYQPCIIRLEDLDNYRKKADEPHHQWPYRSLQDKIRQKGKAEGIGVKSVEPYYSSQTCRKCGYQDEMNRDGSEFGCLNCGYEVNADVNAAMNLAEVNDD